MGLRWPLRHQAWSGALLSLCNLYHVLWICLLWSMPISLWKVACGLHDTVMFYYSTIPENCPPLWMEPPQWLSPVMYNLLLTASQVESVSSALLYWMPALTRRARIQFEVMAAEFKASFLSCLADSEVAQRMQLIFDPIFKSYLNP